MAAMGTVTAGADGFGGGGGGDEAAAGGGLNVKLN